LVKQKIKKQKKILISILTEIRALPCKNDPRVLALLKDIDGGTGDNESQVLKAVQKSDWYEKWGKHYLPSILRAHYMQQCHNFKDPGVEVYGGKLCKDLQNIADDIFCKLPPPTPSNAHKPTYTSSGTYVAPSYTPVASMTTYYDAYGSCFNGEGLVSMADGSLKLVKDLVKGDTISSFGKIAQVVCLTKTKIRFDTINMVEINGLLITPWHPVKISGKWKFPVEVSTSKPIEIDYVYNLVLNNGVSVVINGIECITLGHGIKGDEVASHAYFGTDKVIRDLSRQPGWEEGLIELDNFTIVRDPLTNNVSSILTSTHTEIYLPIELPSFTV